MDNSLDKKIKLNHLRLVCAIDRHRQISVAAEDMAITQPAASRMLVELERLLGAALFERRARGMTPTVFGRAMAERAKGVLLNLSDMLTELEDLKLGNAGTLSVGAVTGAALGIVMPAIERLKESVPSVEVQVNVETSPILLGQLQDGLCDFVLARVSGQAGLQALEVIPAKRETVHLLVRDSHPLASRKAISLADLGGYEWVAQTRQVPIRQALDNAFLEAGYPLPVHVTSTTSLLVILARLSSSDAIAPVASEVANLLTSTEVGAKLKVLPLQQTIQVTPYYFIQLKDRALSPLAQKLKSLIISDLDAR